MTGFAEVAPERLEDFISTHPLAWITPHAAPDAAILIPVIFDPDDAGRLIGHLPKRHAATAALGGKQAVTLLYLGPNGFIRPEWAAKPGWVPTWNFVSAKIHGQASLDDGLTRRAIAVLTRHMAERTASDWTIDNVGTRLDGLLSKIIGFTVAIERIVPRFKLGQDEDEAVLRRITAHLAGHSMLDWVD